MRLPDLLKRARKAKGLTQYQVADLMKINQSNYSKLERGLIDMTHTMILRFCNAIGMTMEEFYKDFESKPKTSNDYIIEIENLEVKEQKLIYKALDKKLSK